MIIRKALFALSASGMVLGSTAMIAAPAAAEELRAGAAVNEAEGLGGGGFGWILGLIIAAGVIGVIAADDDEDLPVSP